ncbi:MAG: hypothetical protein JSV14_13035 [Deltaproteobacteria bacterium]|nr:MAG: hypothetical protein JSV14_13035 [Deltaproteobacteria bacterium]
MDLIKSPNKIFVLSVVAVVVFLWVLVWLFGPQPETIQPDIALDTSLAALLQGSKKVEEEEEGVEEPIPDTWGRDPFALPYWTERDDGSESQPVRTARSEPERTGDKQQYKLSTILISGSNRLAVINYRVYSEGDKIDGEKISEITLDHVVLSDGSEERVLKIPQSHTKVTVEDTGGK